MNRRTCDQALEKLYNYLDGEITWYRRIRISRHLKACSPCGDAFHFEDRLRVVVREKTAEEVPEQLIQKLRDLLRDEGRR